MSPSATAAAVGCDVIEIVFMENDTTDDVSDRVTPFNVLVTTTLYEPSCVALYELPFAPEISLSPRYHWYDNPPVALAVTRRKSPASRIDTVSTGCDVIDKEFT